MENIQASVSDKAVQSDSQFSIFKDWRANKNNPKGRFVLVLFRIAQLIRSSRALTVFFFWYLGVYVLFVEWLLGIELKWGTQVGGSCQLWHGQGLVINPGSKIGSNCILRNSTTIGNKGYINKCPVIGNNVDIGANSSIIGSIQIGDNVVIGAGSVVVKDVPSNCIVAGNPSKVIRWL